MPYSVQIVYVYVKHNKGTLLAIGLVLYSQEPKGFLNCKQELAIVYCYLMKSLLFNISPLKVYFFKPKSAHQILIVPLVVKIDLFYFMK